MHGLSAYGHSWIEGDGATHPTRTMVSQAATLTGTVPHNCGAGGSLSTDTARLVTEIPPDQARIYLVMTGLNDVRLYGSAPDAGRRYGNALDSIFGAFRAAGHEAAIVAVEQPHLRDFSRFAPHNAGSNTLVDRSNAVLRQVAADWNVQIASVTDWDPDTMLAEDTVHPNDRGHAALAEAVAGAVGSLAP
jgi:lysophospholipase L1-like esterase